MLGGDWRTTYYYYTDGNGNGVIFDLMDTVTYTSDKVFMVLVMITDACITEQI